MKGIFNKNVTHKGKSYVAGDEIKKGDDGYEMLVNAGHVVPVEHGKQAEPSAEEKAPSEQEEKPAQHAKSSHKSKR